jgi:hypothetical protein
VSVAVSWETCRRAKCKHLSFGAYGRAICTTNRAALNAICDGGPPGAPYDRRKVDEAMRSVDPRCPYLLEHAVS